MLPLLIAGFASYLIGSIPAGYIAGRIVGIDIRTVGSGNIGATNVTRVLGKRYGYPVFIVDFLKGFAAVGMSIMIAKRTQPALIPSELFGVVGAVACVLGTLFRCGWFLRGEKALRLRQGPSSG